jgi:site-specific DNA-methyltransferase (cytosine-N4-specific)
LRRLQGQGGDMTLDDMIGKIICGDCRELLKKLPDNSIHCCVTSPPYWGLRDYGVEPTVWGGKADCEHEWGGIKIKPIKLQAGNPEFQREWREHATNEKSSQGQFCIHCNAWLGCLGLEPTFELYLDHLIEIFREVKRVVRKDGSIWVNLGDSYAGSGKGIGTDRTACKESYTDNDIAKTNWKAVNIPAKSKVLIPERFAIRMVDELGLICRNTIIWYKRNAMPSSASDRFTVDFEPVFFFVKSGKYYFEQQKEPYSENSNPNEVYSGKAKKNYLKANAQNPSDTKRRILESMKNSQGRNKRCVWDVPTKPFPGAHFAVFPTALVEPMILAGCPENGIVLDPFMGSGTTAKVAKLLNRKYIGFDANPEYVEMANRHTRNTIPNMEFAL